MKKLLCIVVGVCSTNWAYAQPLPDFAFKSPSFTGVGYSSHVLTIENQEHARTIQAKKDIESSIEKELNAKKNTNIAKFMNNLESRIYAQISQNVATAMFATGGSTTGSINFEGSIIGWARNGTTSISLTVVDATGTSTTVEIPLGQFVF
jgi:23S rRNA pseudoU1915 N3-methylase RlmH